MEGHISSLLNRQWSLNGDLAIHLTYCLLYRFGGFLVDMGRGEVGDVITVFFAILIGSFYIGQAGPYLLKITQARGAAGEIYTTIDRVSVCVSLYLHGHTCHAGKDNYIFSDKLAMT